MSKISLNEQAQEILRIAEQHGVEQNFFFLRHLKGIKCSCRYLMTWKKPLSKMEY